MHLSEQKITLSSSVYSLALEVCVCLFAVSLPTLQREYRLVLVTPSALTWVPLQSLQSNIYIAWLITSPGSLCTLKRAKLPASFINRASGLEKNRCFNRQQNFIFFLSLAKFYPSSASSFISSTSTAPSGDPLIVTGSPSLAPIRGPLPFPYSSCPTPTFRPNSPSGFRERSYDLRETSVRGRGWERG